jgi:magnesium-transporting ATPase (P-type)
MEKMQQIMMKRYKMFAGLGLLIVLIAFLLSLQAANANAVFFSVDKITREAAGPNTNIVAANVTRQSISHWVPSFKFLGLGILLGSITMALGLIATSLRKLGVNVMSLWPKSLNPSAPPKPRSAKLFPMLMIMGWMILLIGLIWALISNGTVAAYWDNSIANTLNPAVEGSTLLNQLGTIQGVKPWLSALRYTGMAFVFSAITVALTIVIRTLQHQEKTLRNFIIARTAV